MKIDEAIGILTTWKDECSYDDTEKLDEAERLGIEALKKLREARHYNVPASAVLLPGETKD